MVHIKKKTKQKLKKKRTLALSPVSPPSLERTVWGLSCPGVVEGQGNCLPSPISGPGIGSSNSEINSGYPADHQNPLRSLIIWLFSL